MASYNKVFLMGNLTRDPQVKHLPPAGVPAGPRQMVVASAPLAKMRSCHSRISSIA